MLSKQFRLPSSSHPESPRVMHTALLKLLIWSNNLKNCRFSVVVAKRIDTRAVERNRLRRIIYQSIQDVITSLPAGYDIRIIMKKPADKTISLSQDVLSGLKKAGILP